MRSLVAGRSPGSRLRAWDAISILEPELRAAKIDMDRTHDNALIERALAKYRAPLKE
jgi:hypothetical protein